MRQLARQRFTFWLRVAGAAALIAAADRLLFHPVAPGATLSLFALAWAATLALVRPDVRRDRGARTALVAAAGFALALADDPGLLDWTLFWGALASAALLPRHRFDDAIGWGAKLLLHALIGFVAPIRDALRLAAVRRAQRSGARAILSLVALPLVGGAVFVALFASANPLIENAFAAVQVPNLSTLIAHAIFWGVVLLAVWPSIRPRGALLRLRLGASENMTCGVDVPLATLTLSLVTFNAIFAVENALDLAFLWSGAPLPAGVTLADYAHRGAYPLIITALLAGGFVLVASRPGSAGARSAWVRRLVVLWIAQNVLLVASSIRRTLDYVAAYSLTELRIAALAWMGLVAAGLVLIVWRMLAGRSMRWLVNANALAATLVLSAGSVSDLGAIAAAWNVRHARAAGDLDLCYLRDLGPSALLPLIELERRAGGRYLQETAASLRQDAFERLAGHQANWRSWTWRGARRLAQAEALLGPKPRDPAQWRLCTGRLGRPFVD